MAPSAKPFSLLLLLILLSSLHTSHARDSQFFNKIPSTTTHNDVVPNTKSTPITQQQQEQQPNFLPDNENAYGLYGHESGQLPPSATANGQPATTLYNPESKQPLPKYLPKNYNPTAYVTEPEDVNDSNTFTEDEEKTFATNPNDNINGAENYYERPQEEQSSFYNRGSSFSSRSDARFDGTETLASRGNYYDNGNGFEPQGMSDTRVMENGKYFYDVNADKYSKNHPYESLKGVRERNYGYDNNVNRNYDNNGYEFNRRNYQNLQEDQFQDEEFNNMP